MVGHHFQGGKRGIWVQINSCCTGCLAPERVEHLGVPKMSTHRASFPRQPEGAFTAAKCGNPLADFINLLSEYMHLSESLLTTDNA